MKWEILTAIPATQQYNAYRDRYSPAPKQRKRVSCKGICCPNKTRAISGYCTDCR